MLVIDCHEESDSMSIFILEDDAIQAQQLKRLVEEICERHRISYDFIEVSGRSNDIIKKMSSTTKRSLYFLDIEIKNEEKKGLQVAQKIRKLDPKGIIVFVTTHSEFAPVSYQYMVSALTFIDKGLPYEKRYTLFEQTLLHYHECNQKNLPADSFIVENAKTTIRLPFDDIEYIATAQAHRLTLVATNRMISFYGTLKEIETSEKRLTRCHQSYLVNLNKIVTYDAAERMIIFKSGNKVPVSRRLVRKIRPLLKGESYASL